jgi:hypothetical protein
MTRFLSRTWDDPAPGRSNKDTECLFAYHQATKHTYHSVRTNARYLDWHNQPDPFRSYEGAPRIDLPREPGFPDIGTFAAMGALAQRTNCPTKMRLKTAKKLSSISLGSVGCCGTRWRSAPGRKFQAQAHGTACA